MNWLLLQCGPGDHGWNMALDEALLESASHVGKPILRFYSWTEPAASFGYFQKVSEVEKLTRLRPLVRRPTAGGIVPHDADWTYSLIFPPNDAWYELSARESYRRVHEWIRDAFARIGIPAEVAMAARRVLPGQCFEGHEQFDLLLHGRKIAGAAQRRNRYGLLIQGSIQPPLGVARSNWEKAMCDAACSAWDVQWENLQIHSSINERARSLAAQKYLQQNYLQRR